MLPFREAFETLNRDPDVRKTLLLSDRIPGFYLDAPYLKVRGLLDETPLEPITSIPAALEHLDVLGVTHGMDVELEDVKFALVQPDPRLELFFDRGGARLYRIRAR